ncbi:TraB/GumN family protein [Aurantiacibacter odishensis]|uniref:TraB/GumN family protein n=1 Tax=Aurantiacibacter odishensis TaxID=1155476 RepID=UPI000E72B3B3|nr:TraB/GumN family protein [Aurantiacibacter odishensis]
MFRKLTLTASALALSLGTLASPAMADDHAEASGPALWSLSDEDTTIYLFGTIHVLPEGETWFDDRVAAAFDASEELVFEIDMDEAASSAQMMASLAMLPEGQTLRSLMTEENRAEYEAALDGLGVPAAALDPVEPWAATLNLAMLPLMQAGWQPNSGVEMVLRQRGEDKQRGALETVEEQIALFDTLPMDAQLELLDATVENLDRAVSSLEAMKAEWLEGDADTLGEIMNEEMDDPELYERLLVNRNRNWVDWIETRMDAPGTVFVAVGAGHLAGEGSVQSLLEERGLTVERIDN